MLSLVDATPAELRAIADFYDTHRLDPLMDAWIRPVIASGQRDKIIGFERMEEDAGIISSGDVVVGFTMPKETP